MLAAKSPTKAMPLRPPLSQPSQSAQPLPVVVPEPNPPVSSPPAPISVPGNTATVISATLASPSNPLEACGKKVFVAYDRCMERECKKAEYAAHAECVKIREMDDHRGFGSRP